MATKKVKCMKCKCEFESKIDKLGVPYNRLCEKHRKMTENEAWAETMQDISILWRDGRRKKSSINPNVYFEDGYWVGYFRNFVTMQEAEVCRGLNEEEVCEMRKSITNVK